MAINDLKNKWRDIEWRNTAKTLPARAADVARSPIWRRRAAWALGVLLLVWALALSLIHI